MENETLKNEKVKQKESYGQLISFFIFEVLAITAFTLANSIVLYSAIALVSLIFILIVGIKEFKIKETGDFFIFLIPLVVFVALTSFSQFALKNTSLLINIISFIGVFSFAMIGFLSKKVSGFKISNALLVIYSSIAILVLISLALTMITYVPFYPLLYRGYDVYFNGSPFPAYISANQLLGFEFQDVSLEYFSLFPTLLFTSVVALRFLSFKENRQEFIIYLAFAILGFVALLFTLNDVNIITDIAVVLFLLFVTFFPKKGKANMIFKIIFYCALVLTLALLVVFFLNSQSSWESMNPLQNFITANPLLNRLFNGNRISLSIKKILDGSLSSLMLGYNGSSYYIFSNLMLSNSVLFDSLLTSGYIAVFMLVVFGIFVYSSLKKYYLYSSDSKMNKHLITAFAGTFIIYSLLALDMSIETHNDYIVPLTSNPMFLIFIYLVSYSFAAKKRGVPNE
ncbi:MAG: hypothetical protein LBM03_01230 [Erysipelotrichaceae bacterium]|jgi:hypothetical protein|nr:hypothetical protein [Erysipelotrichaceae bacterium]